MATNIKMYRKKYFKRTQCRALKTHLKTVDCSSYNHSNNIPSTDIKEFSQLVSTFACLTQVHNLQIKY